MTTTDALKTLTSDVADRIGLRVEPMAFFYSGSQPEGRCPPSEGRTCAITLLRHVRDGETVYLDKDHYGCGGAGYYLGFTAPPAGVAEFVSTGIPGKIEGERYKKTPDLVRTMQTDYPVPPPAAPYAVFKPVSALADDEFPQVVICFGTPDEIAALHILANFGRRDDAVIVPMCAGCASIVTRPLLEADEDHPRAVLGMFDTSARPCIGRHEMSFAVPVAFWAEMCKDAPESFLITKTWANMRKRIVERADGA